MPVRDPESEPLGEAEGEHVCVVGCLCVGQNRCVQLCPLARPRHRCRGHYCTHLAFHRHDQHLDAPFPETHLAALFSPPQLRFAPLLAAFEARTHTRKDMPLDSFIRPAVRRRHDLVAHRTGRRYTVDHRWWQRCLTLMLRRQEVGLAKGRLACGAVKRQEVV